MFWSANLKSLRFLPQIQGKISSCGEKRFCLQSERMFPENFDFEMSHNPLKYARNVALGLLHFIAVDILTVAVATAFKQCRPISRFVCSRPAVFDVQLMLCMRLCNGVIVKLLFRNGTFKVTFSGFNQSAIRLYTVKRTSACTCSKEMASILPTFDSQTCFAPMSRAFIDLNAKVKRSVCFFNVSDATCKRSTIHIKRFQS